MKNYKTYAKSYSLTVSERDSEFNKAKISCSKDAADYIRKFYSDDIEIFESFFLLMLNRQNNTIGYVKISQGGTSSTVVDLKIIAKYCLDCLASTVVLAHNHPSGNLKPSKHDLQMTKKVKDGLKLFDISVLDHIILTYNSFLSFADECIL